MKAFRKSYKDKILSLTPEARIRHINGRYVIELMQVVRIMGESNSSPGAWHDAYMRLKKDNGLSI